MPTSHAAQTRSATTSHVHIRGWLAAALLIGVAGACQDLPTARRSVEGGSKEISSGTVGASQRQFFFLLRDLTPDAFQGTFDPSLSPEVTVCLWAAGACQATAAGPVSIGDKDAASLRVEPQRERYVFQWKPRASSLQPNAVYRLTVRVGGLQLGYLDMATGRKQRDLREINRREFLPLRVGSPVTVAFRIEQGPPIPDGVPGRYESDPSICVQGCLIHTTPDFYVKIVWGGVELGDLGSYGEATVLFEAPLTDPNPTVPPVPAPGSVAISPSSTWSYRFDAQGAVEIWVGGMEWGHWRASGSGAVLAPELEFLSPLTHLESLVKLPGVTVTP